MKKTVITLDTTRSGYSIQQILDNYTTITVGELKELLDLYDDDSPIIFKNDNGYTYGEIYDRFFDVKEIDITPEVKPGEKYHLEGWSDEVIADSEESSTYIDATVTILDEPDESGWVRVIFENNREEFVDLEALSKL